MSRNPKAALAILAQLDDLDVTSIHYHRTNGTPELSLWIGSRTHFFEACERLGLKPHERGYPHPSQREWFAERNGDPGLLVQCASFQHHADWEARS